MPGIYPLFRILLELTRHQKKRKVDKDPRSDCLILGADPISSIQFSASPELPSTPQNPTPFVSPLLIPSLARSEETLTNTDGESPTVSITFDEPTIESSTVTSPNITDEEATQYDIDLSENADYSKDRDFLGKPIIIILGSETILTT